MKKRDLIIVGAVLILALACALFLKLVPDGRAGEQDMVLVYLGSELYGAYPLAEERTVRIEQADGAFNQVRITGEGVYMEDANCSNHKCIQMGTLTRESVEYNQSVITCQPHLVVVELVLAAQ